MKSRLLNVVFVCALISTGAAYSAWFIPSSQSGKFSADGSVLFNDYYRWTEAGGWELWAAYSGGTLGGAVKDAYNGGSVVIGLAGLDVFRWTAGTGMVTLTSIYPGETIISASASAAVVVTRLENTGDNRTYRRWGPTNGWVTLVSNSDEQWAVRVSADGSKVVGSNSTQDWTLDSPGYWAPNGDWSFLVPPSSGGMEPGTASLVSADGSVIAGNFALSDTGFRWSETGGLVYLHGPIVDLPIIRGLSADGNIILGYDDLHEYHAYPNTAILWDADNVGHRISTLLTDNGVDLTGWDLISANSASYYGSVIHGYGTNPDGVRQYWIADITPSPYVCLGDLAPLGNPDGLINLGDYLIASQMVLGLIEFPSYWENGDLYPTGGDGIIDLSDLILMRKLVLPDGIPTIPEECPPIP